MPNDKNDLGLYLKKLRKTYGYTQEYVASQLNIIHQTYSHYETGRILPPSDSLFTLAQLYSIPIEVLMKLTVSYDVDSDHVVSDTTGSITIPPSSSDLSEFLEYIELPKNQKKFKNLNRREKEMLYYFQKLPLLSQDEVLDILKIKCHYQKKKTNK